MVIKSGEFERVVNMFFRRYGAAKSQMTFKIVDDSATNERFMNVLDGACNVCLIVVDGFSFSSSA